MVIVPYLTRAAIEKQAAELLVEYAAEREPVEEPPVPIDDVVELHLRLTLELKDLRKRYKVGDVHGAIWLREQRVEVDKSLDPYLFPAKAGRYRFTLAHEAGHWRLHRHLFLEQESAAEDCDEPDFVCQSSNTHPLEWQANYFAAALLMPRSMVARAWLETFGSMQPISPADLTHIRQEIWEELQHTRPSSASELTTDMILEHAAKPLAKTFQVSPEAMRIRLEDMKLLHRKKQTSLA